MMVVRSSDRGNRREGVDDLPHLHRPGCRAVSEDLVEQAGIEIRIGWTLCWRGDLGGLDRRNRRVFASQCGLRLDDRLGEAMRGRRAPACEVIGAEFAQR